WYGAVLGAILVVFSVAVYALMSHHILVLTDAALAEELEELKNEVGRASDVKNLPAELMLRFASHSGYEFQVTDGRGGVLFRSDGVGPRGLPTPGVASETASLATVQIVHLGRSRLMSRSARGPSGPTLIQAIVSLAPYDHAMRQLLLVLILT